MTELPSREKQLTWRERGAIVNSWADRELMTAVEYRDTIDYEATATYLERRGSRLSSVQIRGAVDAALKGGDTG